MGDDDGIAIGLVKFGVIREQNTNPIRFLWVWIEYNRALIIFMLTQRTRLIIESYLC